METKLKELYESPLVKVVYVGSVGVVCQSGGLQNYNREKSEDW